MGVPNYSDSDISTSSYLAKGKQSRVYPKSRIESGAASADLPFGSACLLENEIAKPVSTYLQYNLSVFTGNKGVKYTSVLESEVFINIVYAVSGYLTPLSVAVTGTGISGDPYVITIAVETENYIYGLDVFTGDKGIRYTAVEKGVQYIDVVYVVSGNLTPLSIARTGDGTSPSHYVITANLETDAGGVAITTAAQLRTALLAESDVTDIVTPTLLGTGATVLTAQSIVPLISTAAGGVPLSTAEEVYNLVNEDEDASALVSASLLGTGATVVTAFSSAPLVNVTTSDYPNTFGIVVYGQNASDLINETYLEDDQVGVGKIGFYTVSAYETVAQGDPVRVRLITDGDELQSQFGTTSHSGETALIQGARYYGYNNGLAEIFLPDAIKFIAD